MTLEEHFSDALAYANFLIEHIVGCRSARALAEPSVELSGYYRALAVCELFSEVDVDRFFHLLIHGALTRKHFLLQCHREGLADEPEQRSSLLGPVFDAVAANQFALANELMRFAAHSRCDGFEDEIDFRYARVIEALLAPGAAGSSALNEALASYAEALEGDRDPRLAVATAVARRDAEALDAAMDELIEWHRAEMKKLEASIRSKEASYATDCTLFVEGLALLRIAERLGLPTRAEYPMCPSVARLSKFAPFVPASFPNMPSPG